MAEKVATPRLRLAALDTNILIHLAEGYAPAHNLVLRLIRMGIRPIVTQTVVQELGYQSVNGPTEGKRTNALMALTQMRGWGIQPAGVKPVGNGICEVVTERFLTERLLPQGEKHDIYVIVEASFYAVEFLFSWDSDILNANETEVNRLLVGYDLNAIRIRHPKVILEYDC